MSAAPRRSARALFATTVLVCEAFVVLFAALVAFGLRLAAPGAVAAAGSALAVLCVLAAGLVRRGRAGYVLGWVVQVLLLATGFVVGAMFAVGAVFVVLWLVSLRTGGRIDVERGERERAEAAVVEAARDAGGDAEHDAAGRADGDVGR